MKKLSLSITFLLISVTYLLGQDARLGVRGGYSTSNWSGFVLAGSNFQQENLSGFHLGLYGNIKFSSAFALEPGAYYSQKGTQGTSAALSLTVTNSSTYLDVPLLLRLYVGGFNFAGGPQLSLLLSNEAEVDLAGSISTQDTAEFFEEVAFDLVIGIAYDFDIGVNINAMYDIGVSNILVPEEALLNGNYFSWLEAKNRVVKLSVGISF